LLLAAAAWCLLRGRPFAAGALLGLVFAIKLYSAPFFFYFTVRRQWKALLGMVASVAFFACGAIAIFGFDGVRYFVIFDDVMIGMNSAPLCEAPEGRAALGPAVRGGRRPCCKRVGRGCQGVFPNERSASSFQPSALADR
jgi:hypothetical protein